MEEKNHLQQQSELDQTWRLQPRLQLQPVLHTNSQQACESYKHPCYSVHWKLKSIALSTINLLPDQMALLLMWYVINLPRKFDPPN